MNKELQIVIPSYRRMARQSTLSYIPNSFKCRTHLVLDNADAELAPLYFGEKDRNCDVTIHIVPPHITTIAQKRAYIIQEFERRDFEKILMFDDDLRFAVRIRPGEIALRPAEPYDTERHIMDTDDKLNSYVHVGWSARQGNNNLKDGWHLNGRMMYCLGYNVRKIMNLVRAGKVELGRIETREDMELNLQLLKLGRPNIITADIACDQVAGYAAKGGCSDQRTVESSNDDAEKLAALHPGFVTVKEKEYKGSINRKEVIVYWKKAYEYGRTQVEE